MFCEITGADQVYFTSQEQAEGYLLSLMDGIKGQMILERIQEEITNYHARSMVGLSPVPQLSKNDKARGEKENMRSFLGSAITDGHEEEILFVTCSSEEVNVADSDSAQTPEIDISDDQGPTV